MLLKTNQNSLLDFRYDLGDLRLRKRGLHCISALNKLTNSCISKITKNRSEAKAFYRFLMNEKVTLCGLVDNIVSNTGQKCFDRDICCFLDTTEIGLKHHYNRIKHDKNLGVTSDNKSIGVLCHPSYVCDLQTNTPLGFGSIRFIVRKHNPISKKNRPKSYSRPIEEKESNKWFLAVKDTIEKIPNAKSYTFVEDREGDIYEQFEFFKQQNENVNYIIRCRRDRITASGKKLRELIDETMFNGTSNLRLTRQKADGSSSNENHTLQIKFIPNIEISSPYKLYKKQSKTTNVGVVYAISKEDPTIEWIIYTSIKLNTIQDALFVLRCYRNRWGIETLFKLLKSEGFNIESTQLELPLAIQKLTVMCMSAAILIKKLRNAWIETDNLESAEEYFTSDEIKCLEKLNKQLEGSTTKQKNPFKKKTFNWAAWVIARLGGWSGYESQRKPGLILLNEGYTKFTFIYTGYVLQKDVATR